MDDLKSIIGKVATGATLSRDEAASAFDSMMSGEATPSQMGGLLMALRVRGETVDEITGAVSAMRGKMLRVTAPADAVDVVGTGGDGGASEDESMTGVHKKPQIERELKFAGVDLDDIMHQQQFDHPAHVDRLIGILCQHQGDHGNMPRMLGAVLQPFAPHQPRAPQHLATRRKAKVSKTSSST